MTSRTPFRERRLSPEDARRIVERAVSLGAQRPADDEDGAAPALTEAELAQKLAELGLPDDAIRTAMTVTTGPTAPLPRLTSDAVLRVVHESTIEGVIPPERHEDLADAMSAAMGVPGRVQVIGSKLTWTFGIHPEPALTVRSKDGRTHLRVEETISTRAQRTVGAILPAVVAAMFTTGPAIGLAKLLGAQPHTPGLVAFVLTFVMMMGAAAIFGMRRLFKRRYRNRDAILRTALERLEAAARGMTEARPAAAKAEEPRAGATAAAEERVRVAAVGEVAADVEAAEVDVAEAEVAAEHEAAAAEGEAAARRRSASS